MAGADGDGSGVDRRREGVNGDARGDSGPDGDGCAGGGWALQVPRPLRAAAVLVGTATQVTPGGLLPVRQAAANVAALSEALTGPLGCFDPAMIHTVVDPRSAGEVLDLLPSSGVDRLDLCLFYYAGHGVLAEADRLCLALPGSVDEPGRAARTSLPVDAVFEALRRAPARHKVAILDCCYAGRAFDSPAGAGIHLLTATSRTKKARYGEGAVHTGFTGELLRLLADGVPDGPSHLDLATLYRYLAVLLPTADEPCPVPSQRTVGDSGDLAPVRNPAYGTGRTREGLSARARFALRLRQLGLAGAIPKPDRLEQAVRLFAGIVADGTREFSATDPRVLAHRHALGSLVGEAGDAAGAVKLLDAAVADWAAGPVGDQGLEAARASLAYWRERAAGSAAAPR
ncbi:caspase, EACC1-associated type [Streptomyces sp. 8N706]|uniref:caspase, EACC1-associated type n=1 Tax=Streptomyces sp. 8N706 TaxID=3457416 RepID=UPI003FD1FAEE